jgi:hypothetical protein
MLDLLTQQTIVKPRRLLDQNRMDLGRLVEQLALTLEMMNEPRE